MVNNVEGISSVEVAQVIFMHTLCMPLAHATELQLAGNHMIESGLIIGVSQPGQKTFVGSPNALYQFVLSKEKK